MPLRAFCHTARLGSVTGAASHIRVSQPSVSSQLRKLEEKLEVALFLRRGPRITLTRAGERLYALAMPLVEGMDRLADTFAERWHGIVADALRIGAGETSAAYLLPRFVERFRARWPEVRIEVRIGTGERRLEWLRGYELDLVVASMDAVPPDLEFHPVHTSRFVLIVPADHALAGRQSVTLVEAEAYPFVGRRGTRHVGQTPQITMGLRRLTTKSVVEVDGWGAIADHVAAGVGIAFVPDLCLIGREGLRLIPLVEEGPPRRYGAVTRRDGLMGLAAGRFLGVMTRGAAGPL